MDNFASGLTPAVFTSRAREVFETSSRLYPNGRRTTRRERSLAYADMLEHVSSGVRTFIEKSHAGYYGSATPHVFAVGWTRGGVEPSQPPRHERWDLALPGFGDEHSHINWLHALGAEVVRALASHATTVGASRLAAEEIAAGGSGSVLFTNITPECMAATEGKHNEDWRPHHDMFASALRAFAPLVIIAAGGDATSRYLYKAYPVLRGLEKAEFIPRKVDGSVGVPYWRRVGVVELEGRSTGYIELPFHPSYGGRYAPFHDQAAGLASRLAIEVQALRAPTS